MVSGAGWNCPHLQLRGHCNENGRGISDSRLVPAEGEPNVAWEAKSIRGSARSKRSTSRRNPPGGWTSCASCHKSGPADHSALTSAAPFWRRASRDRTTCRTPAFEIAMASARTRSVCSAHMGNVGTRESSKGLYRLGAGRQRLGGGRAGDACRCRHAASTPPLGRAGSCCRSGKSQHTWAPAPRPRQALRDTPPLAG
jgi:hypothetical protein